MPELPEVEVVRAGLEPAVSGALITAVDVVEPRSLRRHDPAAGNFAQTLSGRRIESAVRRGKFLWFPLAADHPIADRSGGAPTSADPAGGAPSSADPASGAPSALVAHLGMSGQMLLRTPDADPARLLRIRLYLDTVDFGERTVDFVDQRIFGSMAIEELVTTTDGWPGGRGSARTSTPASVAHIARDPLDPGFDDARFQRVLASKSSGIKRVLLDQTVLSGVGNIYADEALWAARIHYEQPAASLSRPRTLLLLAEVRLVLERALAEGGTSFDSQYVNVNGASGYFSRRLRAYGREGHPCERCGTAIVRDRFMNRSSFFCPRCQRLGRTARSNRRS